MKISILLPFYNEAEQIPVTLNAVEAVLKSMAGIDGAGEIVGDRKRHV